MNLLKKYIAENGLNETVCMNLLQENGAISDNCVTAADVPDAYFPLCRLFLAEFSR